jgi:hypothetical protein
MEFTHRDLQVHLLGLYDEKKAAAILNSIFVAEFGPASYVDPDDLTSKLQAKVFTLKGLESLIEASHIYNVPTEVQDALEAGEAQLKKVLKLFTAGFYQLGDFPQRRQINLDLTAFQTPEVLNAFLQIQRWKMTGGRTIMGDPEKLRKGTNAILTLQQLCALSPRALPPMRSSGPISP